MRCTFFASRCARVAQAGVAVVLLVAVRTTVANAAAYNVTKVVDNSVTYQGFEAPTINNSGVIAFSAALKSGGAAVYETSGGGGSISPILHTTTPDQFVAIRLNDAGDATFVGFTSASLPRVYRYLASSGGSASIVADTSSGAYKQFWNFLDTSPLIGPDGHVVFNATLASNTIGIYDGPDPATSKLIDQNDGLGPPNLMFIGSDNAIYFRGTSPHLAFYKDPAHPTLVLDLAAFNNPSDFQVNASGQRLFNSFYPAQATAQGLFSGGDVASHRLVDTTGAFDNIGNADLNDTGAYAFFASLDDGRSGIFTGPDALSDKVIATGDSLFGSSVTSLRFAKGFDNAGDIAFGYTLSNHQTGIAVASVPEPSTVSFLAGAAIVLLMGRRSRVRAGAGC